MKKIGAIISLCVIGVLIALTIVLSIAPLSHKISIASPDQITVYNNNSTGSVYAKNDADATNKGIYEKVVKLIDKGFQEKILTAIFNGRASYKAKITTKTETVATSSGIWVQYQYNDAQTMKDGNEAFTGTGSEAIKFKRIYFSIAEEDSLSEVKAYVVTESSLSTTSSYYYTILANFSDVNEYIKSL